ncbi:Cysteine-rich membrane protein 2 [Spironucleus salmonicida]|uniref:Cysteine-rich membrane protein 2 n=1 Tax=Spironucleus salmonicida TaxID=348837 RepID=V6LTP6_9EUKA|nr:Cysteine-rich membrane protein 2 [Spironucleus salmonicida]|eukprot:EST47960.1 Cysteine-rich membrane protein 2 [Spironucleus salmonicida]
MSLYECPEHDCPDGTVCPITNTLNMQNICQACGVFSCGKCLPEDYKVCVGCVKGKYLSNQKCLYCSDGCDTCIDSSICTKCEPGRFLADKYCIKCDTGCRECQNSQTCINCFNGYFLNSNYTCSTCSWGCLNCSNTSQCSKCKSGFFLAGSICKQCSKNCSECSNETICTKCVNKFTISGGSCVSCPNNCIQCNISGQCNICDSKFYKHNTSCGSCSSNCLSCKSNDECQLCDKGYTLQTKNNVTNCRLTQCNDLNPCKPKEYCLAELGGNYCFSLGPNCLELRGYKDCKQCEPHYVIYNKGCVKCGENCEYCMSDDICQNCFEKYFVNDQSKCQRCSIGCQHCTNADDCYQCLIGYELINGYCKKLVKSECQETKDCPSQQFCLQIPEFSSCEKCIPNCEKCNNLDTCEICKQGFVFQKNLCVRCPKNCDKCYDEDTCLSCQYGYKFNQKYECSNSNCSSTQLCEDGKFCDLQNATCKQCQENCLKCASLNQCQTCKSNYSLSSQMQCVKDYCFSDQYCQYGEFCNKLGGKKECLKCEEGCKSCINSAQCEECYDKYNLENSRCEKSQQGLKSSMIIIIVVVVCILVLCITAGVIYYIVKHKKQARSTKSKALHNIQQQDLN